LLASVPYRNQLNFTWDGLQQAAASVDRLRNFRLRLTSGQFAEGRGEVMARLVQETKERFRAGLEDDLNTAQAQAAIFDMVRTANAAIDAGQIKKGDVGPLLEGLAQFDEIFAVLKDDDAPKMTGILEWAKQEGRDKDISPELLAAVAAGQLCDGDVEQKIAEMESARKAKNFTSSDAIRAELTAAGILVEISKDGVRWRRK
jgi:cysteinyl-tRNA synthetase